MENKFVSEIPKRFKEEYLEQEEVKLETKSAVHTDLDVNFQSKQEIWFDNGIDRTSAYESKPFKEEKVDGGAKTFQCLKCCKRLAIKIVWTII